MSRTHSSNQGVPGELPVVDTKLFPQAGRRGQQILAFSPMVPAAVLQRSQQRGTHHTVRIDRSADQWRPSSRLS